MKLLDTLLSVLAPHECLGCFAEGRLVCEDCRKALASPDKRCYKCLKPTGSYDTCQLCRIDSPLASVRPATRYTEVGKDLVAKLKFGRAGAAAEEIADIIADRMGLDRHMLASTDLVICHSPTATSRIRQRGYDQSELVARALARRSGIPYHRLLTRTGQKRQMHSSRAERKRQMTMAYHAVAPRYIRGARVLLVDDVSTTGSTLEAAAAELKRAGATRVDGVIFAKA